MFSENSLFCFVNTSLCVTAILIFHDFTDFLTNFSDGAEPSPFSLEEVQDENQQNFSVNDHQHQIGDDILHTCIEIVLFGEVFPSLLFVFPDAEVEEPIEAQTPTLNETTLLTPEEAAFALEPVAITRMQLRL